MHIYGVGELYNVKRTSWPETIQYNWRAQDGIGEHELIMFLNRPSAAEVYAVRKDRAEFGLCVMGKVIFFLYKFGTAIAWSDAPYSIHLVPPEQRQVPKILPDGVGMLLNIVLVDAGTGIIKALRAISMPHEFTTALHQAIIDQAAVPFSRSTYNGELENIYGRYSSEDLAAMATVKFSSKQ